ncbi:MAG: hypothetical protein WDM80_00205 [Limisphaerales bacterium]
MMRIKLIVVSGAFMALALGVAGAQTPNASQQVDNAQHLRQFAYRSPGFPAARMRCQNFTRAKPAILVRSPSCS